MEYVFFIKNRANSQVSLHLFCTTFHIRVGELSMRLSIFFIIASALLSTACKRHEVLPALGDKIASPIDAAADKTGTYFYALNSDYHRDYASGSILVIDSAGNKIKAIETPRIGRSLTIAGDTLIATFSNSKEWPAQVRLYDISSQINQPFPKQLN